MSPGTKVNNHRGFIYHGIVDRTSQIWSDRNFHRVILCGMADRASLIWRGCYLCRFIVRAWLTVTA